MQCLEGKVALVTGASRGIGKAIALRLAARGAAVGVNYSSDREGAGRTVAEIQQAGGQALAIAADVGDRDAVFRMLREVEGQLGPVEVLVNNAGTTSYGPLLDAADGEFDRVMGTNVKGPLYCVQAAAPGMIERRSGRIVNISSVAAMATAAPDVSLYAVSKGALNMLTKRLAFELGEHGIRVNAVCPGPTDTALLAEGRSRLGLDGGGAAPPRVNLLGRVARPDEIASVVEFLACDESSFVTAQVLTVDGGVLRFLSRSD